MKDLRQQGCGSEKTKKKTSVSIYETIKFYGRQKQIRRIRNTHYENRSLGNVDTHMAY